MRSSMSRAFVAFALVGSFLSAGLSAQQFHVSPVMTQGSVESVAINDPDRAGQTIPVQITSSGLVPETMTIEVKLDANGDGATGWQVPSSWSQATFSAPGLASEVSIITP